MFSITNILSISLTLFLVIDVIGSVPVILNSKQGISNLKPVTIVLFAGVLMISFSIIGEALLHLLGIEVQSFSIAGALVLLLLGLEMIIGWNIFKAEEGDNKSGNIVPIAFPILIGAGTLTTILSLRTQFTIGDLTVGILINLLIIYIVLRSMNWLERKLGSQSLVVMKKFFGIVLIALAVQMFMNNV
jgi:multiple antibiotic resistance protein